MFWLRLKKDGVKFAPNTTVTGITDKGVTIRTKDEAGFIPGNTVVLAAGFKADSRKTEMFQAANCEILAVGDCVKARMIKDAVEEGFAAGKSI